MNIYDVAKKAKVSIATVSRALNPETRSRVAAETLKKIDAVVEACRYTPSLAAKNLTKSSTRTIGVVFPHHPGIFLEDYYTKILSGVADGILDSQYHLKVIMLKCEKPRWDRYDFKSGEGIDGLIVTHWHAFFSGKKALQNLGIPMGIISDPEEVIGAVFLSGDHREGGRLAAEHFWSRGHRHFALLSGPADSLDSRQRVEGFSAFLKEKGIELTKRQMACGEFQEEKGAEAAELLLKKAGKFTALFSCNDAMAFGALRKMRQMGKRCPQDVSIIGYDDDKRCETTNPPLTSVRVPVYDLAREAARELILHLNEAGGSKGETLKGKRLLPVELVKRASVRTLA